MNLSIKQFVFGDWESQQQMNWLMSGNKKFPDANKGKNGLILYGVYGSGKTTLAEYFPAAYECVLSGKELNMPASFHICNSSNSNSTVESLNKMVSAGSLNASGVDYFILDEADNLNPQSQANLKGLMSSCAGRAVFILTTNKLPDIDKGIRNRSIVVNMNAGKPESYIPHLGRVAVEEYGTALSEAKLKQCSEAGDGSWRDMIDAVENACLASSVDGSTNNFSVIK